MLKAGIIGLGVGEAHIAGYHSHPDCKVVALCDFNEDVLKQMGRKYPGMKVTPHPDEILEDPSINVVSIASYDNFHHEQIIKAIQHGKHIFVEKPICIYEEEAVDIRKHLQKHPGIKISSNLILRKSPRFKLLKSMIDEGKFGNLFYMEGDYNYGRIHKIVSGWRGKIDFYSGVYGGGVHLVDLFLWLSGGRVEEVSAYGNNIASAGTGFKYNDLVASILRFENGMLGKMAVNLGCVFPHFHPFSIYGTKASFVNGLKQGLLWESRDPAVDPKPIEAAYPGIHKGDLVHNFIEAIIHNTEPEVGVDDLFRCMSVCFAIEKASRTEKAVKVTYI